MAGFNLIQELKDVVSAEFRVAIDEIIQTGGVKTNAELILSLCKLITSKIEIYTHYQYIKGAGKKILLYGNKSDNKDTEQEAELMVFATQLIYLLRTFIHNEEITYHFASKSSDGKYSASAFVPQKQVLQSLSKVKKNAIGVTLGLQKDLINQNKTNNFMQLKRENLWNRVEELAEPEYSGAHVDKINKGSKSNEAHWAYQKQRADMQVYVAFSGKNKAQSVYYNIDGSDSLLKLNKGWLWEWYNSILYGATDEVYEQAQNAIKQGSLKYIIQTPDYIAGTKQGDYKDIYNRQIQSKYANTKIISYNNIRNIIYNLELSLTEYIAESANENQKIFSVLQEHFFPESATAGNAFVNDTINQLTSKLGASII